MGTYHIFKFLNGAFQADLQCCIRTIWEMRTELCGEGGEWIWRDNQKISKCFINFSLFPQSSQLHFSHHKMLSCKLENFQPLFYLFKELQFKGHSLFYLISIPLYQVNQASGIILRLKRLNYFSKIIEDPRLQPTFIRFVTYPRYTDAEKVI